jgi:hypothetical protein
LKPEEYRDHTVYMDSEEDVDLDDNEGTMTSNNNNNHNGHYNANACSNAEANSGPGCVYRFATLAVRGWSDYTIHMGTRTKPMTSSRDSLSLDLGSRKVRLYD